MSLKKSLVSKIAWEPKAVSKLPAIKNRQKKHKACEKSAEASKNGILINTSTEKT